MKAEFMFPEEFIEQVAERLFQKLKPILSGNGRQEDKDAIFTLESLAEYLQVDTSWVYRQVSDKTIPYFKNGKYVRFKKSSIDNWISSNEKQPIPKFKRIRHSKVNS